LAGPYYLFAHTGTALVRQEKFIFQLLYLKGKRMIS